MEEKFNIPTKKRKHTPNNHVICNLQDCKTNVVFEGKKVEKVETFLGYAQRTLRGFQHLTQ